MNNQQLKIKATDKLILAIDMGGTTAKMGFATLKGKVIHRFVVDTLYGGKAISHFNQEVRKECEKYKINYEKQIVAIGFGCVGPLDLENGVSINAGKIGWYNYPVVEEAQKLFQKPIFLINDARSIAVGEWKQGAGKGYKTFLIYSLGTGLGGGIILDNKLYRGAHNFANEFGHGGYMQNYFQCGCGLSHCIEGISSARGIEKYFQIYIQENPKSSLANRQSELGNKITIKDVADLIKAKDRDVTAALSVALKPLASSISLMIYAFDPEAILIGGGPSALGQPLIDILNELLSPLIWDWYKNNVDIKLCQLGNDAGLIGVVENTISALKTHTSKK